MSDQPYTGPDEIEQPNSPDEDSHAPDALESDEFDWLDHNDDRDYDVAPPFVIDEPPIASGDTKPKAPIVLPDEYAIQPPDDLERRLMAEEPPINRFADTAETPVIGSGPARGLMLGLVMLGTVCLCVALVSFAGFAGYRDGLATNDVKITQTLATGIAEQYALGVADLQQGHAEMAVDRFAWIVETVQPPAQYARDSAQLLATSRAIGSYTPTAQPTDTPAPQASETPTLSPSPEPTLSITPTVNALKDPAYLYQQAVTAMSLFRYEEAIEWLDALRSLAPNYRAVEAQAMLLEALTEQGEIYLYGRNEDGEDMLARGVLLIYRADELGPVEPSTLMGQAIFVESYINARSYVAGGYFAAALPILEDLCAMNCEWGYPNIDPITVSDLLEQARAGASTQ
ncbi:MAG: hypothetical protein EHM39_04535 [Chloroflexi bacterium]|nr:MAG: hypothetical protein EHM39_04535 [Chloroflexota bacterium]